MNKIIKIDAESKIDLAKYRLKFNETRKSGKIFVEEGVSFGNVGISGPIYVGKETYVVSGTLRNHIEIGRFCSMGREVMIGSGIHDDTGFSTSPYMEYLNSDLGWSKWASEDPRRRVIIGNDVWIGDRAYVMSGVKIGNGAIIGTNAVVTKDVLPYSIVAGIPAKHLRYRFSDMICKKINDSKWWNIPLEKLKQFNKGTIINLIDQVDNYNLENKEDLCQDYEYYQV